MKLTQELLSTSVTEARGIYEPVTDADLNKGNETLVKRGGVLRKGNGGALQVVTDGDKTLKQSGRKKSVTEASEMDDENRRNAEHLETGDSVEITGDVSFKGETGEITHFGKDKRFVVVKLHSGGEHSFHSSDVSEVERDFDEDEGEGAEDHNKFYVAFYDSDEERSWIGMISKEHGGKWHEKTYKGKPEYRWGQTYMSYLSPEDIMRWIHKDYGRSVEIEGPFYDAQEAVDHVKQNWGTLAESANAESACYKANKILASAYRKMLGDKTMSDKVKKEMTAAYKMLRNPLEDDDIAAFKKAWKDAFLQHPDGFDALMDPVYDKKINDYDSFKKHFKLTEAQDMHDADEDEDHSSGRYTMQKDDEHRNGWKNPKASETVEESKKSFEPGDRVHIGFGTKGGAGYVGKLLQIDHAGRAHVELEKDGKFGKRVVVGLASHLSTADDMNEDLSEGLSLLKTCTVGNAMAKVYKDSESGEYQVKLFKNGEHTSNHHTEDLANANHVAEIWTKKNATVTEDFTKTHKLVSKITGEEIKVGQIVKNFRGEKVKVMGWWPGRHPGSTGRVETDKGAFYPSVIDAEVVPVVEPYVKKVEEAEETTEWGISEKGAGSYNDKNEWVHAAPTWYKTRNERHQHAQRLKKQGKDFNTYERTVKGVKENAAAWAVLNDAARAMGADSFSRLSAIDAANLVDFKAANEITESMFGGLTEAKSLMGKMIRISNPKHNMSGHKGKVVWCNDDGTECEMEYAGANGKKDKCSVSTKDITVESVKRFWTLSPSQMQQVIESHPELLIGSALDALNEGTQQTPWDVLTKLAQRHGVEYFSQLTPAIMDKYINYKAASDHAAKDFGKHDFEKLEWQQMMHIIDKHPEFLRDEAKAIYAPEPVEEELKFGSFSLSPADEKDIPFLNKLMKDRGAAKRQKEAEARRQLVRKMSEPSNTKNEPEAGHRKGAEARISLIRDLSTPRNA